MNVNTFLEAIVREFYSRGFSDFLPFYVVNEYPKSGGTWIGQMLSSSLEVPFPRNCIPKFESSIMHGHHFHHFGLNNVLCVWRDGRDVLVSWYYHCLFKNERRNSKLVDIVRSDIQFDDYFDIRSNLPRFIDYVFNNQKHPAYSWAEFVRKWYGRNDVVYVRYEDMLKNGPSELMRITYELNKSSITDAHAKRIVAEYSFSKLSGRERGDENMNSFMRKGIAGDWVNHFSPEARRMFDSFAGDELILLGYEKDHSWVTNGN